MIVGVVIMCMYVYEYSVYEGVAHTLCVHILFWRQLNNPKYRSRLQETDPSVAVPSNLLKSVVQQNT